MPALKWDVTTGSAIAFQRNTHGVVFEYHVSKGPFADGLWTVTVTYKTGFTNTQPAEAQTIGRYDTVLIGMDAAQRYDDRRHAEHEAVTRAGVEEPQPVGYQRFRNLMTGTAEARDEAVTDAEQAITAAERRCVEMHLVALSALLRLAHPGAAILHLTVDHEDDGYTINYLTGTTGEIIQTHWTHDFYDLVHTHVTRIYDLAVAAPGTLIHIDTTAHAESYAIQLIRPSW